MTKKAYRYSTPNGTVFATSVFEAAAIAYPDKTSIEKLRRVRRFCVADQDAVIFRTRRGTPQEAQQIANETGIACGYLPEKESIVEPLSPPVEFAVASAVDYECKLHTSTIPVGELFYPEGATDLQKKAFELDLAGYDLKHPNRNCWHPLRSHEVMETPLEAIELVIDGTLVAVTCESGVLNLPSSAASNVGVLYKVNSFPDNVTHVEGIHYSKLTIVSCNNKKEPERSAQLLETETEIAMIPFQSLSPAGPVHNHTLSDTRLAKATSKSKQSKLLQGMVVFHTKSRRFGRVVKAESASDVTVEFMHEDQVSDTETSFTPFDVSAHAFAQTDFLVAHCLAAVTIHADYAQGDFEAAKEFTCQLTHALKRPDAADIIYRTWPPIALVTDSDAEIARLLLAEYGPHLVYTEGAMRRYNPATGIWEDFSDVKGIIAKLTNHFVYVYGSKRPRPFSCGVQSQKSVEASLIELVHDRDWFDNAAPGIAFTNGFLTLDEDYNPVLRKHSPDNRAIHSTGVPWDYTADCIYFKHFLYTQSGGNDFGDFIVGLAGAALLGRATDLDVALFLLGDGGTGKSTTIEALKMLFPKSALSSVTLQDLSSGRGEYYRAQLSGKLFNAVEELPSNAISDTSTFKALVSGGEMEARHPAGRPFTLKPRAAHIFCLNEMPTVSDTSDGFYRRLAIVNYDKKIDAKISRQSNLEQYRKELAGLYKFAVLECGVLLRRRRDGEAFIPTRARSAAAETRRHGESVQSFISDCVLMLPSDSAEATSNRGLYTCYTAFCKAAGMYAVSLTQFGRRLSNPMGKLRTRRADGVYWHVAVRSLKHWTVAVDESRFPADPGKICWVDQSER